MAYLSSPVPVTDNSGSLTVDDGATTLSIDDGGGNISIDDGGNIISVDDGAGSLTVDASSWPLPTGAATETTLGGVLTTSDFDTKIGSLTETAPATDTASSGLNGRLQRIAQRVTSLIALVPTALTGSGNFKVALVESTASQAVTNANLDAGLSTLLTTSDFDSKAGSLTETSPATDTASSGLNGRLQRIAQRITSLIALLPSALVSGRLDVNLGAAPATVTANSTLQAGTANVANVGAVEDTIDVTLTRPANQTAYTAGDEMTDTGGTIRTLTGMATATGKKGTITGIELSVSTNAATKPDFTVFIYDTTSTPQTDNAAFAPSDAEQKTCIGYVRITDFQVGDATATTGNFQMSSGPLAIGYKTAGSANLFLRVKVNAAYTAGANSDEYLFRVKCVQDL